MQDALRVLHRKISLDPDCASVPMAQVVMPVALVNRLRTGLSAPTLPDGATVNALGSPNLPHLVYLCFRQGCLWSGFVMKDSANVVDSAGLVIESSVTCKSVICESVLRRGWEVAFPSLLLVPPAHYTVCV